MPKGIEPMTDADLLEIFNERAGIREFEGGQTRAQAELSAMSDIAKMYGPPLRARLRRLLTY